MSDGADDFARERGDWIYGGFRFRAARGAAEKRLQRAALPEKTQNLVSFFAPGAGIRARAGKYG